MPNSRPGSKYYGVKALKSSFVHFVLGKSFSASSSIIVLLLIIRNLSVLEFAVYTSLHAMALIIGLLSTFGVNSVLLRYLPELRTHNNNRSMYRLMVFGIVLRAMLYAALALIILPFTSEISSAFNFGVWSWLVPWYLVVGFLRINASFMVGALESLLWQRAAQYSIAASALVKLVLVATVVMFGDLTLTDFVVIECVVESISLALLCLSLYVSWSRDDERGLGSIGVLLEERKRYIRFGFWSYMQGLTSVLYGSAPNRLFVSYFFATEYAAIFGVMDRLIDIVRRYEPMRLFVGLIRPVFMSRFSQDKDFSHLVSMANLLFRVNLIILVLPLVLFAVAGDLLFDRMTAGKYEEVTPIFIGFYAIALISSIMTTLDILVRAVEHTKVFAFSNLILSGSLGIAIPLIPYINIWSVAIANTCGLLMTLVIVVKYLKRYGYTYTLDWYLTFIVISYCVLSVLIGHVLRWLNIPVGIAAIVACTIYVTTIYFGPPLREKEKILAKRLLPATLVRATGKNT